MDVEWKKASWERGERQKCSHSLDVPSFTSQFLSPSPQKPTGRRSVPARSSSVLQNKFLRVLLPSCVTGRLTVPKQTRWLKGHSDRGREGQRALHTLLAGSGSLDKRDINRNTNKYRHSHKAALWRSFSKILFSISRFSFPFIK